MSAQFFQKLLNPVSASKAAPLDGEILYSRNSVCIHPPSLLSNAILHHTGYLTITAKVESNSTALLLNWSPNSKTENDNIKSKPDNLPSEEQNEENEVKYEDTEELETKATINGLNENIDVSEPCVEPDDNSADLNKSPQAIHNFQFPENSIRYKNGSPSYNQGHVIRPPKNQAFGSFHVNLAEMRSMRVFFRNVSCTCGELIIASQESQYKVLHFHNGGLDCVATVLLEWKALVKRSKNSSNTALGIHHFSIVKPLLHPTQRHPEEGLYKGLTTDTWNLLSDEYGRIQNEEKIQKAVFFGGVEKELRHQVWPFLLKYYKLESTVVERDEYRIKKMNKYQNINEAGLHIMEKTNGKELDFWKNVACSVEKDVLRTDRANPYYQGEGNPNLDVLQRILFNYSVYSKTGYTQGMSDLLSPLLIELANESDTFWCFVGLMQRTIFISSPSDQDMEKQLLYLREMLRLMLPQFYSHLITCGPGSMELLFTHRWILLCFKREFTEDEALLVWEACWAHYQTNYFHLFVSVAIISLYGTDVYENKLASDEMLLHFSHLAMQMNGQLVLKKARGLLHNFRMRKHLPCTLRDICCLPSTYAEEAASQPKFRCAGSNECEDGCVYGGTDDAMNEPRFNIPKFFKQQVKTLEEQFKI
ncbi:TBC1 domain family member 16-like [Ciona intestinalis]